MPRRILVVAFATALVLLTLQSPAAAKGPVSATITGPGIDTMRLTWNTPDDRSFDALVRLTRLWDSADGMVTWDADRPAGDLGPRFEVTYRVPDLHDPSSGKATQLRQDLYPFAADGPVVFMPEGQAMYDMDLPHGWLAAERGLTRLVTQLRGTPPATRTRVEPAAHEATTTGSDGASGGGSGWRVLGWAAAGAVLLGAAVGGLRLRTQRRT